MPNYQIKYTANFRREGVLDVTADSEDEALDILDETLTLDAGFARMHVLDYETEDVKVVD